MTMIKNELLLPTVTQINLTDAMLNEASQTQQRTLLKDFIYG